MKYRLEKLASNGGDDDHNPFHDWNIYLLPFFLPQFVTLLFYPAAVISTLADVFVSQRENRSILLWRFTTTAVSLDYNYYVITSITSVCVTVLDSKLTAVTGNILYLMFAGINIFITIFVMWFLLLARKCSEIYEIECGSISIYTILYNFNSSTLLTGTIITMAAIFVMTLIYVSMSQSCWLWLYIGWFTVHS